MGLFFKSFLETQAEIAVRIPVCGQKIRRNVNNNTVIDSIGVNDRFVYLSGMD